ncbi:MAG: DUF4124 domain-containing protein [Pseudomonadota bacterium]
MARWPLLLLLLAATAANTETVYKSVDEQGVTSFSDTPPAGESSVEVLQIDVPEAQDPEAHKERLASMRETTDRMAEDRREREKHRAELRAAASAENPPTQYVYPEDYTYPSYYYGGYRRVIRPPFRPKPEHPIHRPPLRPELLRQSDPNSQLMRPLVSSRR